MENEKGNEKCLYFTEITRDELRIINLMRAYVAPYSSTEPFTDFIINEILHKILTKAIKMRAFIEVMQHERNNKEVSDKEMFDKFHMFENFIEADDATVQRYVSAIFSDIYDNIEEGIQPIDVYKIKEKKSVTEILDKINTQCYNEEKE